MKPDWKNLQDYEYMKTLKPNQWAWEFLRRNPEYIKDWHEYNKKCLKIPEHSKWPQELGILGSRLSLKWRVSELGDPNRLYKDKTDDPHFGIGIYEPGGTPTITMGMKKEEKEYLYWGVPDFETGKASLTFNFQEPIEPQLRIAKKWLLKLQQKAKQKGASTRKAFKPRHDEWILLLRVYDAKATGIKDKEIASLLFPDEDSRDIYAGIKKVHDKYLQAKRYVENDYRLIPYSEI